MSVRISYNPDLKTLRVEIAPDMHTTRTQSFTHDIVVGFSGDDVRHIEIHGVEPAAVADVKVDVPQAAAAT
ncbi:MAG TPA: hypothetical protein VNL92_01090 [Dehalococcoidia bacterium]|nr:hypothetical protein [Dehalococcoidia bacterium]